MALLLPDHDATVAAGCALGAVLRAGDLVTLSGPLGAGKTSFARGVLAALGFAGEAPSPSYPIVIAYDPPDVRVPLAHVDLYRIADPGEVAELALDEYRADGAVLVEWPEHGAGMLGGDALALAFAAADGGGRRLTWTVPAAWGARWPPR